jgi:4-methyl-5(b-hydroxyethyl)-thiazole monophosphate biosynthesis
MHKKNVLVPIANGIEEIEAVTIIDVLRRAGVGVRVTSIEDREITAANGVKLVADSSFVDEVLEDYDGIILPGGTDGAKRFFAHTALTDAIKKYHQQKMLVGAICASPAVVLAGIGLLAGKKATCYPSFKQNLPNYVDEPVVVDGSIVTSQGPGTAFCFALKLAEILAGEGIAREVKAGMLA